MLVNVIETLIQSIDTKYVVAGYFMDLSKAFGSVWQSRLVTKLCSMGISRTALEWFKSYLESKLQSVEIPHKIKHGVPQGSILKPLLFLLYQRHVITSQ